MAYNNTLRFLVHRTYDKNLLWSVHLSTSPNRLGFFIMGIVSCLPLHYKLPHPYKTLNWQYLKQWCPDSLEVLNIWGIPFCYYNKMSLHFEKTTSWKLIRSQEISVLVLLILTSHLDPWVLKIDDFLIQIQVMVLDCLLRMSRCSKIKQ